jgi:hypothetical protein
MAKRSHEGSGTPRRLRAFVAFLFLVPEAPPREGGDFERFFEGVFEGAFGEVFEGVFEGAFMVVFEGVFERAFGEVFEGVFERAFGEVFERARRSGQGVSVSRES